MAGDPVNISILEHLIVFFATGRLATSPPVFPSGVHRPLNFPLICPYYYTSIRLRYMQIKPDGACPRKATTWKTWSLLYLTSF